MADVRKKQWEQQQQKRLLTGLLIGAAVVLTLFGVLFFSFYQDRAIHEPAPVNENGDVVIPKSKIKEQAAFYSYDGLPAEIIVVRASDGSYRTLLNACSDCYETGESYYQQNENYLRCEHSYDAYQIDVLGLIPMYGYHLPPAITSEMRSDTDKEVVIPRSQINLAIAMMQEWDKGNYVGLDGVPIVENSIQDPEEYPLPTDSLSSAA